MLRGSSKPGLLRNPRATLGAAVGGLALLSLLPASVLWPLHTAGNLLSLAVSPIEAPLTQGLRWLRGPSRAEGESERLRAALDESQQWRTLYMMEAADAERLRDRISNLEASLALDPALRVRLVTAQVISVRSDGAVRFVKVKAGASDGVTRDTVATVGGIHLLGRIDEAVAPRLSHVLPVTDRASRPFRAVLLTPDGAVPAALPPDALSSAPACLLKAAGNGTMEGDVVVARPDPTRPAAEGQAGNASVATVGMVVYLADPAWPAHAQMLIVGKVERVERKENTRQVVVVRPMFSVDELGEVVLRSGGGGGSGGADGAGGTP